MSNKLPSTKFGLAIAIGVFSGIGISNLWNHFRRFIPIGRKFSSILSQTPPKKSKIYTRTGDAGTSSLYNGERRSKNSQVFYALGETDELNASIGIAREYCELSNNGLEEMLAEIQSRLFDLGAAIATPITSSSDTKLAYTEFPAIHTQQLEEWIDHLDAQLPPLTNFVIPSGGLCSTHINMARAICRRAERACVPLVQDGHSDSEVGKYLNRLSDLLFVASRYATKMEGRKELIWKKAKTLGPIEEGKKIKKDF